MKEKHNKDRTNGLSEVDISGVIDEIEAFNDQDLKIDANQEVFTFYCLKDVYIEDTGIEADWQFEFSVPLEWICDLLSVTKDELITWKENECSSEDITDIYWTAIQQNQVVDFKNLGIAGYYS